MAKQLTDDSGEYDHRVTIWRNEPTTNDDGQQVELPAQFIRRWAAVEPMNGREFMLLQQTQADLSHRVRMWSDSQTRTITTADWLTLRDGTRLDVKSVANLNLADVELELMCNVRQDRHG
jgi:SPP1 family predicted phage head-tail adaptor